MMKLRLALIIATLAFVPYARAASPATFFTYNSQPGDYIGQGITQTFTPADGTFTVQGNPRGVQVSFHTADYSSDWNLSFGPPSGQGLIHEEYEGAQRFAFHSPTAPGLEVTGDGRGCNTLTGRFLVSEAVFASTGTVQKLAIDFEQHCEGAPPALYGSVRFNSAVLAVPRVSIEDSTALKGSAGTSDASVIVSLCLPSAQSVTAQYATQDGTGVQGTDYVASSGAVSFQPGTTAQSITIPIIGDRLARGNKTFLVRITNPQGAPLSDGLAIVTILDPNVPLTVLAMYGQPGDYISPGLLLLTVADGTFTPSRNYDNGVSIAVQTSDSWELDFAAPNKTPLTPGAYENAQRFPFQMQGFPGLSVYGAGRGCNTLSGRFDVLQATYAPNGNVQNFSADFEQHCEGANQALFGSIRIKSLLTQLSVTNAVVDKTQLTAVFTVTLNPPSDDPVSVDFATVDGTATAGVDYVATTQTLSFAPGESAHTVTVPLLRSVRQVALRCGSVRDRLPSTKPRRRHQGQRDARFCRGG